MEKRYPYIIAYGKSVKSNDSYIRQQVKRAVAEKAPADTFMFDANGDPFLLSTLDDQSAILLDLKRRVEEGGCTLPDAKPCAKCKEDAEPDEVCVVGLCPDCEYLEGCDHE